MANTKYPNPYAVRLDAEDKSLLRSVALHMKLPYSEVIRIAIRRIAEDEILGRRRAN